LIIRCTPHNEQTPLTYDNLVSKFCDSLEPKYPKFDRQKFLQACGVEVEKEGKSQKDWCKHYDYLPYKEEDLKEKCLYCKENRKGKSQKGEKKCDEPYCKQLSAVGRKCLEHYQSYL
jgi:hypothetical protein